MAALQTWYSGDAPFGEFLSPAWDDPALAQQRAAAYPTLARSGPPIYITRTHSGRMQKLQRAAAPDLGNVHFCATHAPSARGQRVSARLREFLVDRTDFELPRQIVPYFQKLVY